MRIYFKSMYHLRTPISPPHPCCQQNHNGRFFFQLMMAVEYLHSIGVAHRDLKLENVLLTDDGQSIKVTDFGLAARLDEWEGGSKQKKKSWGTKQKLRRQQTACGTHAYVAPEVVDSSVEQRCGPESFLEFMWPQYKYSSVTSMSV